MPNQRIVCVNPKRFYKKGDIISVPNPDLIRAGFSCERYRGVHFVYVIKPFGLLKTNSVKGRVFDSLTTSEGFLHSKNLAFLCDDKLFPLLRKDTNFPLKTGVGVSPLPRRIKAKNARPTFFKVRRMDKYESLLKKKPDIGPGIGKQRPVV